MNSELAALRANQRVIDNKLEYKKYPVTLWCIGVFLTWFGLYLLYSVILGAKHGTVLPSF